MSHYDTLGVPRDADAATIKAAYRRLASQHHPDRGGDKEKSAAVNDAYACLSDSERRARYDAGQDDELPPSPEEERRRQAMKILGAVIDGVLEDPAIEHAGIVRTIRQELRNATDKFKSKAADAKKAAARLERVRGRLVRKAAAAGDDLVAMILGGKIDELQRREADSLKAVEDVKAAIEMLEGYENEQVNAQPGAREVQHQQLQQAINQAFGLGGAGFRRF